MEHSAQDSTDHPLQAPTTEEGGLALDREVEPEMMNRAKREEALAWAQAHKLIRGGVDEVAEFIERSQYTIELLLQALREANCRDCDYRRSGDAGNCESCRRRTELLAQLA
jgi:hypothetical protein